MSKEKDFTVEEMLGFVRDASIPNPANIPGWIWFPHSSSPRSVLHELVDTLSEDERAEYEALKAARSAKRIAEMEAANTRIRAAINGPNYMKAPGERAHPPHTHAARRCGQSEPTSVIAEKLNDFNSGLEVKELCGVGTEDGNAPRCRLLY